MKNRNLTNICLRTLAANTKLMRAIGCDIKNVGPDLGWSALYDVEISGHSFTLWCKEAGACSIYAITKNGRVRFIEKSNIFSPALDAWEAITGITYLQRYDNGSPVYGHHLPVKIIDGTAFPLTNYSKGQVLVTEEHLDMPPMRNHHNASRSELRPMGGEASTIVGRVVHLVCGYAERFSRDRVASGNVVGVSDGLAVVRVNAWADETRKPIEVFRLRELRHLYG